MDIKIYYIFRTENTEKKHLNLHYENKTNILFIISIHLYFTLSIFK